MSKNDDWLSLHRSTCKGCGDEETELCYECGHCWNCCTCGPEAWEEDDQAFDELTPSKLRTRGEVEDDFKLHQRREDNGRFYCISGCRQCKKNSYGRSYSMNVKARQEKKYYVKGDVYE